MSQNQNDTPQQAVQVSEYWGNERRELVKHNWLEHPVSVACINQRRANDPALDRYHYWQGKYLTPPAPLALSIGCGFGAFERVALEWNLVEKFDACDLSESAIIQARSYASQAGLENRVSYAVANLDAITLPNQKYDAIFAISSLHHVRELDSLFKACCKALKPQGLLFVDEYVGPARFQSPPHVVDLINQLIQLLPERYRRSAFLGGEMRQSYANPPVEWFEQNDPSEAIESDQILPRLRQHFEIIDFKPYGGALLHMLLSGTAGNFDPHSEADATVLRLLAFFEEQLEKFGVISSDFVSLVARPLR